MATMVALARALSRTPRTRIHVTASVIASAGMLKTPAGWPGRGSAGMPWRQADGCQEVIAEVLHVGRETDGDRTCLETAYSRIRSQPIIHATISPRMA